MDQRDRFAAGPDELPGAVRLLRRLFIVQLEPGQPLYPGAQLPQFTFQVRLHQNNDVDFIYGPSSDLNSPSCYGAAVGVCTYISGIQSNLIFPSAGGL